MATGIQSSIVGPTLQSGANGTLAFGSAVETSGDSNSNISNSVSYHGVTAISVTRSKTLPAASTVNSNQIIIIADESGSVTPSIKINVTPNGTDTIDGANSAIPITVAYGTLWLVRRSSTSWKSI